MPFGEVDTLSVNTIRVLAADVVRKANSGHPGMPMGMAPAAHVLWSRFLKYDATNPKWPVRDRFVLSNGHGCALLYIMLHLAGADVTLDDLKSFRQWGSKTAGHPEAHLIPNIEVTTGPLGQGISNAVGLAAAEKHVAAVYNKPDANVIDNYTYVFCGDGCLQEGVSSEASSLAGHLGLGKLIVIWDDNKITIDGHTHLSFSEDVLKRYEAYGWHTSVVENGNEDFQGIEDAIRTAQAVHDKPSIIALRTTIGFLSKEQGSHEVHGTPLTADDIKGIKAKIGFNPDVSFFVPEEVYKFWADVSSKGKKAREDWNLALEEYSKKYPELGAQLNRTFAKELPDGWKSKIPSFPKGAKADATRNTSGVILNAIADALPELVGGSADLTPSNKTSLKNGGGDFQRNSPAGRYFRFGIREHGMFAIGNGLAAYGCLIPFTATFLNFITYGWGAVRLAALSHFRQIFIMTHDSIGLGEDGPTHQPVEVLSLLRAAPNLYTFRPADGNEVAGSYIFAIEHSHSPSVLCLSRQNCPMLDNSSPENVLKGAYITEETKSSPDVVIISTGSEVGIAIQAAKTVGDLNIRVVSAPCLELFDEQPVEYRRSVLPVGVPIVSFEAQGTTGWSRYAHFSIGIKAWGASAPYERIYEEYGFTAAKINTQIKEYLAAAKALGSIGPLPVHY
eukprot:TRINITY_DN5761_c0_g1_i1.p1 TRINITY_DN5761_c0_g1~~TRINITY_DN5761_c0_g1_i1.p1  ORF type:complete len:675 (+),score=177.67 TRINITY_DN5761_c0_g1_i1:692-2716(+)